MNDPKRMRDALLKQEGLAVGPLPEERRIELERLALRERAHVRRMRRVTATLWILLAALYVFWAVSGAEGRKFESLFFSALFAFTLALFPLAVFSSISLYIHWQMSSRREMDLRLQNLEDELARMREGRQ